jgi:hypothetical protein
MSKKVWRVSFPTIAFDAFEEILLEKKIRVLRRDESPNRFNMLLKSERNEKLIIFFAKFPLNKQIDAWCGDIMFGTNGREFAEDFLRTVVPLIDDLWVRFVGLKVDR